MIRLRLTKRKTETIHAGSTIALLERNWILVVGSNRRRVGFSYRAPGGVEVDGEPRVNVYDHVMLARLAAFTVISLVLGAQMNRTKTHGVSQEAPMFRRKRQ